MKSVDVKDLGKIAVVMGGSSGEREVSLMSGSGVLKALESVGADVVKFDPAEQPLSDLAGIDRAFLILHGKGGEDGVIQGRDGIPEDSLHRQRRAGERHRY